MYRRGKVFLIICLLMILISFVVFDSKVFSYSGEPTHYNLTKEMIRYYNLVYDPDIIDEKVRLILQGSLDEDVLPRPAFHLYDPIYIAGSIFCCDLFLLFFKVNHFGAGCYKCFCYSQKGFILVFAPFWGHHGHLYDPEYCC